MTNMSFKAIRENKIRAKFLNLQYLSGALSKAMDINTIIKPIGGANSQS